MDKKYIDKKYIEKVSIEQYRGNTLAKARFIVRTVDNTYIRTASYTQSNRFTEPGCSPRNIMGKLI